MRFGVSNLGILKRHHFAGSLCYDTPVAPDSGTLAVNLCHDLSLFERVRVLVSLSKGRFQGLPKTRCCLAGSLSVRSERSFALEVDGEVVRAREVRFSVVPKAVQVCQ
ncbi:MAG: hypothetical protein JSU73_00390, partial [candidate division WOR-3 bacterium]